MDLAKKLQNENVFEYKKRNKFWPKPRKHDFILKNYHIQKKLWCKSLIYYIIKDKTHSLGINYYVQKIGGYRSQWNGIQLK